METESEMWSEKFRPSTLDGILGQESIVKRMKQFVKVKNLPHLVLSGPRGTGKTTAAHALGNELYGDYKRSDFMELNASDQRGINVVRTTIKDFAAVESLNNIVPFKLILLDEADRLTEEAQSALRRTMEEFATATRFILCCNYPNKIIEPIQDRCFVMRFPYVSDDAIYARTKVVLDELNVEYDDSGVKYLAHVSRGSFRRLYTYLQVLVNEGNPITEVLLKETVPAVVADDVIDMCKKLESGELEKAEKMVLKMYYKGVQLNEILDSMYEYITENEMDKMKKIKFITWIGNTDYYMTVGANPILQMRCLLAKIVGSG